MNLSFQEKQTQARALLSENAVTAFDEGFCVHLQSGRNPNLGNLLGSERALFYMHIAYRMLLFRREHELEPLHEDLYRAVRDAQQSINDEPYQPEHYTSDINNLHEWKLITIRLEKERIKGYKDTRRTKYRYGLTDETIRFLVWLEERLQDDIEEHISDARDLLEEVAGTIKELRRFLNTLHNQNRDPDENEARRILYQINKLDQLSHDVDSTLNEFNARLLGFLVCDYDIGTLRELLKSLHLYVEKYLSRIGMVRETLLPDLRKINSPKSREKIRFAKKIMDQERLSAPREFRARSESADPIEVPAILIRFYKNDGRLDVICHRINDSALRVWRRMSTHLKELERKSHRIDDLRARMAELASKPEEYIPVDWMVQLLSWGHMRGDMHQWDEHELAEPPRPKKGSWKKHRSPVLFLESAKPGEGVALSMEQTRLNLLKEWLQSRIVPGNNWKFSVGPYTGLPDLQKTLELARAGILGNGKKLKSIDFMLTPLESETVLQADRISIRCNDMEIKSK